MCVLRPCVRRKFPNFHFLEFRKCSVFEVRKFFGKNRNFRTRGIFAKKFGKKFGNSSSVKCSVIIRKFRKFRKNDVKFEVLGQKNPVFRSKSSEKFGKKFGKSSVISEKVRKFRKLVFPNVRKFRKFRKFGNSELSENFEKMTYYSNFGNSKIFVPTRKPTRKFG